MFDFLDVLDFDLPGTDFAATPVLFAFTGAFGAGGILGLNAFDLGTGGSLVSGLITGFVFGGLAALLFGFLKRQESVEGFEIGHVTGLRGRCTLAITPPGVGRVSVEFGGMTRSLAATSSEPVAVGDEVVVTDVIGQRLTVAKARSPVEGS
jgi:membrane protein implicated in regulation of membrane protease activity